MTTSFPTKLALRLTSNFWLLLSDGSGEGLLPHLG